MFYLLKVEKQEPNSDFKPNLVNTVCFLVQFIIQLITFGVNYQVRRPPFVLEHEVALLQMLPGAYLDFACVYCLMLCRC